MPNLPSPPDSSGAHSSSGSQNPSGTGNRVLITERNADLLARRVAEDLSAAILQAQKTKGQAHVVLTGGTIGIELLRRLRELWEQDPQAVDVHRVDFWFGDERFVPAADADRNALQAREALLDRCGIPASSVHEMPASDVCDTAEESAAAYANLLADHSTDGISLVEFDVLLLGMGPDSHVASLFPGTGLALLEGVVVPVHNSPKPPADRVSLTMDTICSAEQVWVVAAGQAKAEAVAASLAAGASADEHPASAPRGREQTRWYLDEAAASEL